jgi:hypothetical protein
MFISWRQLLFSPQLSLLLRTIAALFGGYFVAGSASAVMAMALPLPATDSSLVAMMSAFIIYALFAIWVFSVKRVALAWAVTLLLGGSFSVLTLLLG